VNGVSGLVISRHLKLLAGGLAIAVMAAATVAVPHAHAQSVAGFTNVNENTPLLLQADELVYDRDRDTVAAVGNVQIDYGGTRLVAQRVIFNQRSGRLTAIGMVEIVQPDGTKTNAKEIDVTEDFANGFVNALRIRTPDRTYFAAESATRENGEVMTFNRGVYTACEPCKDNPEKPPLWQIKAQRIIWNGKEKTIRFERASFEFLGIPLASFPVFTTADPTVKRKTGFLMPGFRQSDELGFGLSIPYFIVLAPNMDLKLTGTGLTRQGFLGEAEFRHRLNNGMYTVSAAGIHQMTPSAFTANTQDSNNVDRGMIGTTGAFQINPRWAFGWDWMAQTDKNFARTYSISGYTGFVQQNQIYLTGLNEQNYFDARVMKYDIQEATPDGAGRDAKQPWVLPSLDYNTVSSEPIAGGELSLNVNARGISRETADQRYTTASARHSTPGISGRNGRITAETEWRKSIVTPGGVAITPIFAAQTDATYLDATALGTYSATGAMLTTDSSYYRAMLTAGLEIRWPILFSSTSSTHVLEPIAQVFARPNEMGAGVLPNEDAQSFIFDTTTLFERDKFTGFDRMEGGHRANVGLRYTGTFDNGVTLYGLFGQSYHLGGTNPFASADFVNVGLASGLESNVSDYVGMFGASFNNRISAAFRARFDEQTLEVRRAETEVGYRSDLLTLTGEYAFVQAQPDFGFTEDRKEVSGSGSLRFHDNWRLLGYATYDITNSRMSRNGIGLAYDDECFAISLHFKQTRDVSNVVSNSVGFRIALRTLGDFGGDGADVFGN
jgi:LPS-assembly protein